MNDEFKKLIASDESETVEFKESFGKAAIETMSAFANSQGGFVCIGVDTRGICKGVAASEEQIKDWLNQIKMTTEPPLFPQYNIFELVGEVFFIRKFSQGLRKTGLG